MKKVSVFLFFAFAFCLSISTVQAQVSYAPLKNYSPNKDMKKACNKVCTKTAAAKLAANQEDIVHSTCPESGKVNYYRRNVCDKSGKVSLTQVQYDAPSRAFVNLAPAKEKKACTKADMKKCAKSMGISKKECAKRCTKRKASSSTEL